jgi:two-component system, LytTR family, response regulator
VTHSVWIVDDEPLARRGIRTRLRRSVEFVVTREFSDAATMAAAAEREAPAVVFLDIEMPGRSGLDAARWHGVARPPLVVFVTAHAQYGVAAFDADAVDYLLKPIDDERFDRTIARLRARLQDQQSGRGASERVRHAPEPLRRFWIRRGGRALVVAAADVDWIAAAGDYVTLHVGSREHLYGSSIATLAEQLDAAVFARVHRSAIVNLTRVASVVAAHNKDSVLHLTTGASVRVSRTYADAVIASLRGPRQRS